MRVNFPPLRRPTPRHLNPLKIEMSVDSGKTWEKVDLPVECLPYHQVNLLGEYQETVDGSVTLYRRAH